MASWQLRYDATLDWKKGEMEMEMEMEIRLGCCGQISGDGSLVASISFFKAIRWNAKMHDQHGLSFIRQ
jgi:hypothetical protein